MHVSYPYKLPAPPSPARQPAHLSEPAELGQSPMLLSPDRPLYMRPVTPADTGLLAELIARLSDTGRRQRFFRPLSSPELIWQEASRVTQRVPAQGIALVATVSEHGDTHAVAMAELVHDPAAPTAAELAVLVRDDLQRQGIGTWLLRLLIALGRERGVRTLHASLQADNKATRRLLGKLGLAYHTEMRYGEITAWAELP